MRFGKHATPQNGEHVCVYNPVIQGRNFSVFACVNAGGSGPLKSPLPTKLLLSWEDIQADHLDVPAFFQTSMSGVIAAVHE